MWQCSGKCLTILSDLSDYRYYQTDWQQICPDSSSLPVRRRQRGVAARQLLLHHAWPPRQEEDQGDKQVTLTLLDQDLFQSFINQETDQG